MAAKTLTLILNSSVQSAMTGLRSVEAQMRGLTSIPLGTMAKWGSAIVMAGAAAAAGLATREVIKLGAAQEQTRLKFQTMLGSVEKGNAILAKLQTFANVTPFNTEEVVKAGQTLLAFGVPAGNVEGLLRKIGDVSSGTGKDLGEMSAMFGKVFAKGKIETEALNQMVEAGVPIIKVLGQMYGKTGAEVYKMAEDGKLGSKDLITAFDTMTASGGIFGGMMDKQSKTISGMWSTVTGSLETTAATLGEQLMPLLGKGLEYVQGWVDELGAMVNDGRAAQYLATVGITGVTAFGTLVEWTVRFYESFKAVFSTLQRLVSIQFEAIQAVIAGGFVVIVSGAIAAINALISVANKIPKVNISLVKEPEFVGQMRQWAEMSADQVKEDFNAITSGKDFTEGAAKADAVGVKVQSIVDKLNQGIMDWQGKTQMDIAKRKIDEKTAKLETTDALGEVRTGDKKKADKDYNDTNLNYDSLAKIGGYGSGGFGAKNTLDVERNGLLKQIAEKIGIQPAQTVLA